MAAFMVPTYRSGLWVVITQANGESESYPAEYAPAPDPGEVERETVNAVGVCLSAPGYMDRTDWELYDNATEARSYFLDTMEVCPQCGIDMNDHPDPSVNACPKCGEAWI